MACADRVGQPCNESCRDLVAVGARQGRLTDAERDPRRGVIDSPSANAPAPLQYAVEVDDHEVASPLARSSGRGRWTQGRLVASFRRTGRQQASPSPAGEPGPFGNALVDGEQWMAGEV